MPRSAEKKLAVNGGKPVRAEPMPPRALLGEEEKAAVVEVFDEAIATGSAFGYGGPREQAYEREFAESLGGGLAKAVNSGTSAVLAAIAALELEPGSEVICPPITDPGAIMPVVMMNCVPVIADTNGFSFNIGARQIAAVVTERTRAIIVAHIMGEPADMAPIMKLAEKHGLTVIEDCAQSHGAVYRGRPVGSWGHLAVTSTMSGKHHCSGAQGGLVFTRDEGLYWKARRFMDRGKPFGTDEPDNVHLGLNLNSNELAGAIGRVQLARLPSIIRRRRRVAAAIARRLASCRAVSPGRLVPRTRAVYWLMRLTLDLERLRVDNDTFAAAVKAEGVPAKGSYVIACDHAWFRRRCTYGASGYPWPAPQADPPGSAPLPLPNARAAIASNFLIPINENWGEKEIEDTAAALAKVERAYSKA